MDSYLTFLPRGLHFVAERLVLQALKEHQVHTECVGDEIDNSSSSDYLAPKASKKSQLDSTISNACCRCQVGTSEDERFNHISVGYDEHSKRISTVPGSFSGVVWMKITTTAPPTLVGTRLRCIGPILALTVFEDGLDIGEDKSLGHMTDTLVTITGSRSYALKSSLDLWRRHVAECWPEILGSTGNTQLTNRMVKDDAVLSYRLSCVRSDKKNHLFKRQQLATVAADHIIPPNSPLTEGWKVELKAYDIEFVLIVKSHCLAIGVSLRPYQFLGAKDFSSGSLLPPDISPPYLSGQILSGLVRLRPTTAQMMLHLAHLEPGDVLLDPCVGIGKIR